MELETEMIYGIFPYIWLIFIYIISTLTSYLSKNKLFFYLSTIIIVIFVGFKDVMTPDFERYAFTFENIENYNYLQIEPLFLILSHILKGFGFNYYSLFFLYSSLSIFFILLGIKNLTNHHYFAFLLFILVPGFFLNMFVEMRQLLAVAIVFYTIGLFLNKKRKYILFALLSIITHYSASFFWIIFILTYPFLKKIYSFKTYFFLLTFSFIGVLILKIDIYALNILSAFLSLTQIPIFQKYIYYVEYRLSSDISQVQFQFFKNIFYILNALFLLYIFKFLEKKFDKKETIKLNLFVAGVLILNFTYYIAEISRFAYYYLIFQIVIIPNIIFNIKQQAMKFVILYVYLTLFIVMFIKGVFFFSDEVQEFVFLNYKNILIEGLIR